MVHTMPMRPQRPFSAVVLALLLGACASPRPPAGFRDSVCVSTDHLRAADGEFAAAIDGLTAGDDDRVAIAAAGMEREADAAATALAGVEAWAPASQLTAELGEAATDFERAASQFRGGARQGNGPELDRAVASAQEASAAVSRVELEMTRLAAAGLEPC